MSKNNRKAVAARDRQREAPITRTADNDQKPANPTTGPDKRKLKVRKRVGITLAPMPIGKDED
jgi:hypothetical protein